MPCVVETLRDRFEMMLPVLDERGRRRWAGVEASAIGRGGISRVAEATGLSRATVRQSVTDIASGDAAPADGSVTGTRTRRPGGGRKRLTETAPELVPARERRLEPVTCGGPESPLRWTCNSAASRAADLRAEGHGVSERTVNRLLHELGYSLQANRTTIEGRQHPDRDGQFRRINRRVRAFRKLGQPVVSVDTKRTPHVQSWFNQHWLHLRTTATEHTPPMKIWEMGVMQLKWSSISRRTTPVPTQMPAPDSVQLMQMETVFP